VKGRLKNRNLLKRDEMMVTKTGKTLGMVTSNHQYYACDIDDGRQHIDVGAQTVTFEGPQTIQATGNAAKLAAIFGRRAFGTYPKKVRFTGKGYKIRKSARSRGHRFNFGRSHRTFVFIGGVLTRKLSKQFLLIMSNDQKSVNTVTHALTRIRTASPFTKRGLRRTRQLMIKRPGKKTTY
jgi:ribosomal protein L6P/L9E